MKPVNNLIIYSIVVTFNAEKWIEDCIASLINSEIRTKIILIDNYSTDKTLELIKPNKNVNIIPLEKNIGFGKANNIGLSIALRNNADFVFLLNQDAEVKNNTLSKLLSVAQTVDGYGIFTPLHLNEEEEQFDHKFFRYLSRENLDIVSDLYFHRKKLIYDLPFANAAAWLITRTCLEIIGGFDPLFFMYGEDDDYCYRVLKHGLRIGLIPSGIIIHKRQPSSNEKIKKSITKKLQYVEASYIHLLKKYERSFIFSILNVMIDNFSYSMKLLINKSFKEFLLMTVIFIKIIFKLPKIKTHRNYCKKFGPAWLETGKG